MGKVREKEAGEDLKAEIARLTEENERYHRGMLRAQADADMKAKYIARIDRQRDTDQRIHQAVIQTLHEVICSMAGRTSAFEMPRPVFPNPPGDNGMVD